MADAQSLNIALAFIEDVAGRNERQAVVGPGRLTARKCE